MFVILLIGVTIQKRHPNRDLETTDFFETDNPNTRQGQTVGAILKVKHKPQDSDLYDKLGFEVNDFVEILSFSKSKSMVVEGRNLRTGARGQVHWMAFKKVNTRNICGCEKYRCYCRYVDFNKSMAFFK